jgi:hypothetical protein
MRMYPALVNCTTIDLFNEWPQEALLEVGEKYLQSVSLDNDEQVFFIFFIDSENIFWRCDSRKKRKVFNQVFSKNPQNTLVFP